MKKIFFIVSLLLLFSLAFGENIKPDLNKTILLQSTKTLKPSYQNCENISCSFHTDVIYFHIPYKSLLKKVYITFPEQEFYTQSGGCVLNKQLDINFGFPGKSAIFTIHLPFARAGEYKDVIYLDKPIELKENSLLAAETPLYRHETKDTDNFPSDVFANCQIKNQWTTEFQLMLEIELLDE